MKRILTVNRDKLTFPPKRIPHLAGENLNNKYR